MAGLSEFKLIARELSIGRILKNVDDYIF